MQKSKLTLKKCIIGTSNKKIGPFYQLFWKEKDKIKYNRKI